MTSRNKRIFSNYYSAIITLIQLAAIIVKTTIKFVHVWPIFYSPGVLVPIIPVKEMVNF